MFSGGVLRLSLTVLELAIFAGSLAMVLAAVVLWTRQRGRLALAWQLIIVGLMFFFAAEASRVSVFLGMDPELAEEILELATSLLLVAGLWVGARAMRSNTSERP
jgi:hypothetical protein